MSVILKKTLDKHQALTEREDYQYNCKTVDFVIIIEDLLKQYIANSKTII